MNRQQAERKLDGLGKRRKKLEEDEAKLRKDIEEALPAVKIAGVSRSEAADRIGLNRTTLYQVYIPDSSRASKKRGGKAVANGRPASRRSSSSRASARSSPA